MPKSIVERLREPVILCDANWQRILHERSEAAAVIEKTSEIATRALQRLKAKVDAEAASKGRG